MNSSPAPLDLEDWTGETESENFVNIFCPDKTMENRAIPVCSSSFSGDIYPDALGGITLRNCDLSGLIHFHMFLNLVFTLEEWVDWF
jgi:hypothetical protein